MSFEDNKAEKDLLVKLLMPTTLLDEQIRLLKEYAVADKEAAVRAAEMKAKIEVLKTVGYALEAVMKPYAGSPDPDLADVAEQFAGNRRRLQTALAQLQREGGKQ